MLRRVALVRADVSEELSASIIRVRRIGEVRTTLAVTEARYEQILSTEYRVLSICFLFLVGEFFSPWCWGRNVPSKSRLPQGLHSVTSQKTKICISSSTSDPHNLFCVWQFLQWQIADKLTDHWTSTSFVRFEVFTVVTMKNAVFWNIKNPVRTSQETHYVSATEPSQLTLCRIWGFHGGDYEECRLLGYKTPVHTSQET
jgi:hypothetical protein